MKRRTEFVWPEQKGKFQTNKKIEDIKRCKEIGDFREKLQYYNKNIRSLIETRPNTHIVYDLNKSIERENALYRGPGARNGIGGIYDSRFDETHDEVFLALRAEEVNRVKMEIDSRPDYKSKLEWFMTKQPRSREISNLEIYNNEIYLIYNYSHKTNGRSPAVSLEPTNAQEFLIYNTLVYDLLKETKRDWGKYGGSIYYGVFLFEDAKADFLERYERTSEKQALVDYEKNKYIKLFKYPTKNLGYWQDDGNLNHEFLFSALVLGGEFKIPDSFIVKIDHMEMAVQIEEICKYYEFLKEMERGILVDIDVQTEPSVKNGHFTTARQVLAIHYLLEYRQVRNIDNTAKARFVQFLTGKETGAKDIRNTTIYKKVSKPLSRDNNTLAQDLTFVRKYFEDLGLSEVARMITNEISNCKE